MGIEKWQRLSGRVRQMGREELLDRGRQALAKRFDAALSWAGHDFGKNERNVVASERGRFFFASDAVEPILELLRRHLPYREEQICQQAEQICHHRFDLLGYTALDYGDPIDWHVDAVHGKRAPKKPSYRIRYLDFAECGDSKVIWELNRHQHFVTLAKAYRLTNDQRYVDEILRARRHWEAENPYAVGINWVSSLESAFRSLSWLWTYHLLCGAPAVPDFREEWLRGLALHGRHIERYLSTYFSPNTHLLGEGVALFFLGVLCPELPRANHWKSLGWQIVLRESERQVLADGWHFEQSTYYHVYALDFFLHASILATLNSIPLPETFTGTLEKMLTALCLMGRSGPPPQFGDDDGGRLFDPQRNRNDHLLDPLSTGSILFRNAGYKEVAGALREETLWLLGVEGERQWGELRKACVAPDSAALPEAGYYLLTADNTQLFVDAGPLGAHGGGHSHADALSICLQSCGSSLLIDSGAAEYVGSDGDRDRFRGTGMHNTVQVDSLSQAETGTVFGWRSLIRPEVEQWIQGQSLDLLVASHNGYQRLPSPIVHRRWVVSLKNGVYLIRDVIEGAGVHHVDIAWHLGQALQEVDRDVFRAKGSAHGLAILSAQDPSWKRELRTKMYSPAYGQKVPTSVLSFVADALLPTEFAFLLVTLEDTTRFSGSFRRLAHSNSDLSRYEYATEISDYSFIFNEHSVEWRSGLLSSDARYVCHKRGIDAFKGQLMFCNGTYAKVAGGPELRCSRPQAWAELVMCDGGRTVFSSDRSAVLGDVIGEPASAPTSTISAEN